MIRTAGGGFLHPKRGFLSAVVPLTMLGIRHFVGTVEAESRGRPCRSTPNDTRNLLNAPLLMGFGSNSIFMTFKLQQRPKHLLKIPAWKPFNMH